MASPLDVIVAALRDISRLLGKVERNVEAKLVAPGAQTAGLGPGQAAALGTADPAVRFRGPPGVEADAFVADVAAGPLRFIVEVKRWALPLIPGRRRRVGQGWNSGHSRVVRAPRSTKS